MPASSAEPLPKDRRDLGGDGFTVVERRPRVAADEVAGPGEGDVSGVVRVPLRAVEVIAAVGLDDEPGIDPE